MIFQENREKLLHAIRTQEMETVKEILSRNDAVKLARAKNYYGKKSVGELELKFINLRLRGRLDSIIFLSFVMSSRINFARLNPILLIS